jgi:hypothetical protein
VTFLELVKRLRQEAGIPGTGPAAVASQTGQLQRLVDWTAQAWTDIQAMRDDWLFLRADFSFPITAGTDTYTPASGASLDDFRYWHGNTLRAYLTATGVSDEQDVVAWDWDIFRDTYKRGTPMAPSRPTVFAERPRDSALVFGPVPDYDYTCRGEYQRMPVVLGSDGDEPELPDHLQLIIVWKALEAYALYESAPEVLVRAQREYNRFLNVLEREQLPSVSMGGR